MASGGELWKRRYDNDRSAFDISVSPCLCVCLSCAFWWILARSDCQQTVSRSETNHCVHVSNEYFTSVTVSGVQHTRSVASTVGTRNNDTAHMNWTELTWTSDPITPTVNWSRAQSGVNVTLTYFVLIGCRVQTQQSYAHGQKAYLAVRAKLKFKNT